ncbi:hypothetical protein KFU94_00545 [Chloroflexi bacterium TSY]|nr:hypothetical protein [Chloroflexi bacterium TSY]
MSLEHIDELRADVQALAARVDSLVAESAERTIELDASVLEHMGQSVLNSEVYSDMRTRMVSLRDDLNSAVGDINQRLEESVAAINGTIEGVNQQIEQRLAALEQDAGQQIDSVAEQADVLASRLSQLEQDEEERMRQHDAARPPGQMGVTPESSFAAKARAMRMGEEA